MELRQLKTFYYVAQLRSVVKAATALEMSRMTAATHLRKLETEFGITLFDQRRRPIKLTPDGVALLELVTPVVTSVDDLKIQMGQSERRGSFVVGAYPDLVGHYLPKGIQKFRNVYPDVRIRVIARSYNSLIQLVRSGEVEMAFCSLPPADDSSLMFKGLFEYGVVLLTPPGHELLHNLPVKLEAISSWPLILPSPESLLRQRVERAFKFRGLTAKVVLSLDDTQSMKRYVEIGLGIGIGSDLILRADDHNSFGVVRLGHIFPNSVIGVCTLKAKFAGQAVQNFVEIMSEQITGIRAEEWPGRLS